MRWGILVVGLLCIFLQFTFARAQTTDSSAQSSPSVTASGSEAGDATSDKIFKPASVGASDPAKVAEQPVPVAHWIALGVLASILIGAGLHYGFKIRRFSAEFAELKAKLPTSRIEHIAADSNSGQAFALASRGPTFAFEAELKSAEARWRQVVMAFPQLDKRGDPEKQKLILVKARYTNEHAVHQMQEFVENRVVDIHGEKDVVVPSWINEDMKDFDVLNYPKLAIANPCIYSLPFFLTWQRRHLWGVLPYATHSKIGIFVSTKHHKFHELEILEKDYFKQVERDEKYGLWVNNPALLEWLDALLATSFDEAASFSNSSKLSHTSSRIFTVGRYVHQELVPLACSVRGSTAVSTRYIQVAVQIEPSELQAVLPKSTHRFLAGSTADHEGLPNEWPKDSAIIVDLALIDVPEKEAEWRLFRLPHGAYVPIGIGYSVLTWPLLAYSAESRKATAQLLAYSANTLVRHRDKLKKIGIELDPRLWQHLEEA